MSLLFPFGERTLAAVDHINPQTQVHVRVEGFQWEWTAYYLNEGIFMTRQDAHASRWSCEVPVDEPVHVTLVSRDVMHEFYVPEFLFMRNAIPGTRTLHLHARPSSGPSAGSAPSSAGCGTRG